MMCLEQHSCVGTDACGGHHFVDDLVCCFESAAAPVEEPQTPSRGKYLRTLFEFAGQRSRMSKCCLSLLGAKTVGSHQNAAQACVQGHFPLGSFVTFRDMREQRDGAIKMHASFRVSALFSCNRASEFKIADSEIKFSRKLEVHGEL